MGIHLDAGDRPALARPGRSVAMGGLAALLVAILATPAEAADPNAPTDNQVAAAVAAADRLMNMGRVGEAYDGIRPIAEARPDSSQATFTLGLAALAAADAAASSGGQLGSSRPRDLYDVAVRSFRSMLVKDPSLLRVRLELGRALFSRGRCMAPPSNLLKHMLGDDCWAAEQHFLRVLGTNVPTQVALNVRRYIQVCRARKRANGSLTLAIAPDTNVNTSTSAQTVNIFGLPFQLNDEARATSGIGVVGSFGAEIQKPIPKFKWIPAGAVRLRAGGTVFRRDYSGGDWDDHNYSAYVGPRFITGRGQMSLLFQADTRGVNGRPYSRQYGLRIEGVRLVMRKLWVGGSIEGSRQTAISVDGPIGKPGLSWNLQSFAAYTVLPSLTVRFMGGAGHENTDRAATRHRSRWVGVMGTYDLPLGFSMTLAQQLFFTNFEQPNYLFSPQPPETQLWFSRMAFFNRKINLMGFSPSISFIREERASNLTLYQYQRYRAEGGFVRVF